MNSLKRDSDEGLREAYRKKQRERQQKYREKRKAEKQKKKEKERVKFSTPQKKHIKVLTTRLRRKREKEERIEAKNFETQSEAPKTPLLVSKSLWNHMSPSSRRKVKGRISNAGTPAGLNSLFRREVGVNLSNAINEPKQEETKLQLEIKNFFLRDDISRTCPDTKRMKVNPEDKEEKVPVRYRLGTLHCLHDKFLAESITGCSLEYFRTNCPFYVIKPKANDWGTCLCDICLNPKLK